MFPESLLRNAQDKIINLPVSTKLGTPIPNEQRGPMHPERMLAAQQIVLDHHHSAKPRSLDSAYNCVGMVFAARRTCIEPEHVGLILREDGFRRVENEAELEIGDVVVCWTDDHQISHVGLIANIAVVVTRGHREITVLSQWGADGEYFHRIDDVNPNLGNPTEFWTDRT